MIRFTYRGSRCSVRSRPSSRHCGVPCVFLAPFKATNASVALDTVDSQRVSSLIFSPCSARLVSWCACLLSGSLSPAPLFLFFQLLASAFPGESLSLSPSLPASIGSRQSRTLSRSRLPESRGYQRHFLRWKRDPTYEYGVCPETKCPMSLHRCELVILYMLCHSPLSFFFLSFFCRPLLPSPVTVDIAVAVVDYSLAAGAAASAATQAHSHSLVRTPLPPPQVSDCERVFFFLQLPPFNSLEWIICSK